MIVAEVVQSLLELDQKSEVWFVRNEEDKLIYLVAQLPNNSDKVALLLPTAVKRDDKRKDS